MMDTLYWLHEHVSPSIYNIPWLWPIMEILHYIGLCLLLGALFLMDLRLLGFNRRFPLAVVHDLIPVVYLGFVINLVTGVLFFLGNPVSYGINEAFQAKMLLIVFAGLNGLFYHWKITPRLAGWSEEGNTPVYARTTALVSLVLWVVIVYLGRVIPYVGYIG